MKKIKLILIHSFPTNSIVLKGLIEFLGGVFEVYPIDLPGFTKLSKPLNVVSVKQYSGFLLKKIDELDLETYVIGGISFGYYVLSETKLNDKCRGILAMEPFLGIRSLKFGIIRQMVIQLLINTVVGLKIEALLWKNIQFRRLLMALGQVPSESLKIILDEIDGVTFFRTARLIFSAPAPVCMNKCRHVLLVNRNDGTVDYEYIVSWFHRNIQDTMIVHTDVEHFPRDLSANYFNKNISEQDVRAIIEYLDRSQVVI